MSKTLGQVAEAAYEAVINEEHRLAGLNGLHLVDEEAARVLDNAWQAAAEAAVREYVKSRREEVFVPEDGPEALQEVE